MDKITHIVLFSGGCGSAYTAYLVKKKYKNDNIILLHTETMAEHNDTKRFMKDVSNFLKIPITYFSDGRSLWELIDQRKAIPNQQLPFCTTQLKQRQTDKFCNKMKKEKINYIVHFGYGIEEPRRVQKVMARFECLGRNVEFLLFKSKITNNEIKKTIINEWKICLPITYKILKHNNCLPCFKGGKNHFYKIWKNFPEYYKKAENAEKKHKHTVFKDITLEDLRKKFENNKQLSFLDDNDDLSSKECMCFL
jgi:hypothetical protein